MNNYYFISSPFHLFVSSNLAIKNEGDTNIAVIIPRVAANKNSYAEAIRESKAIFDEVISFENRQTSGKFSERKYRFKEIKAQFEKIPADRIYTGNDRRVEFQFAMGMTAKRNADVRGIYLDEGTVTYLGHKSMYSWQHKYIDPFFKKVFYGNWWKNPVTIVSSPWIQEVYAAFPELVHPLLKNKKVHGIDHEVFTSSKFLELCDDLVNSYGVDLGGLSENKVVVVLTHESFYPDGYAYICRLIDKVKSRFDEEDIAIKAHPRSEIQQQLQKDYPGVNLLSNKIGMEILLPQLNKDCMVVGDISSVLFTTRWLRPELKIVGIKLDDPRRQHVHDNLLKLYQALEIPMMDFERFTEQFWAK